MRFAIADKKFDSFDAMEPEVWEALALKRVSIVSGAHARHPWRIGSGLRDESAGEQVSGT